MRLIYSLLLVSVFTAVSHSKPITFIIEANVSGGIQFTGRRFDSYTFRASSDMDNLTYNPSFREYTLPIEFAEIDFGNAGVYSLPYWRGRDIYSKVTMQAGNLAFQYKIDPWNWNGVYIPYTPNMGSWWDMKSSYGPVTTTITQPSWPALALGGNTLETGPLTAIRDGEVFPVTFTAIVTPEPSSLCLCIGSIVLLGIRRRV